MASNVNTAQGERGRFAAFFVSVARECDGSFTADRTGCFHERLQPQLHQTSKRGRPLPHGRRLRTAVRALEKHPCLPPASQNDRLIHEGRPS